MNKSGLIAAALLLSAMGTAHAAPDPLAPTGRWSANTAGRAATPPMGWNPYNAFGLDIDEQKVVDQAKRIVDSGLEAKGYRYINLDEGWWDRRRGDGRLLVRVDKFPSARTADGSTTFRPFVDHLHAMGFKAGIYSDLGRNTCAQAYAPNAVDLPRGTQAEREVGLYDHVDGDIREFFGEWSFDLIKVDGCGLRAYGPDSKLVTSGAFRALDPILDLETVSRSNIPAVRGMFEHIAAAMARHRPNGDYLLSLCIWGSANVRAWGKDVGNISRTSDDISPEWGRMLTNFDSASRRPLYAHPGSWNDPDMLYVGKGDFDDAHLTEARSHFAMWAMIDAPLLLGLDLRTASPAMLAIVGNSALIALNQDPGGHQAVLAFDTDDVQIFVKTLANGDKAVAIFNRDAAPMSANLTAAQLKLRDDTPIRLADLWSGKEQRFTGETTFRLAGHETLVFRVTGKRVLADGMYLSELPGDVNPAVDGVTQPQADPSIHRSVTSWQGTRGKGARPAYAGWGGAQADATPYGRVLQVAGRRFDSGLGALANSRLEVRNHGFRRFQASVGVDDSAADFAGAVTFTVYGDGRPLGRSIALRRGAPVQAISADITGVQIVDLVARSNSAENEGLPVVWGDAAVRR